MVAVRLLSNSEKKRVTCLGKDAAEICMNMNARAGMRCDAMRCEGEEEDQVGS